MSAIDDVIAHLSRLPGIGERTATRLAFYLLRSNPAFRAGLSQSIDRLSEIHLCRDCFTVTEREVCNICSSPVRNRKVICVVEKPSDIYSIERMNQYKGMYHVLHGLLSPLEGVGPQDLKITELVNRTSKSEFEEVILALSPTAEGDATSLYVAKLLSHQSTPVSRLAAGLAVGSDLEFADQITLGKAFEARMRVR